MEADSATFVVSENKEESTLYPDCVIGFEHAAYDSAKLDIAVISEQQSGSNPLSVRPLTLRIVTP